MKTPAKPESRNARPGFAPWRRDRPKGRTLTLTGLTLLGTCIGLYLMEQPYPAVASGIVGLVLLQSGSRLLKRANVREFGKRFEGAITPKAVAALEKPGMNIRTNLRVRGLGDIDIVVSTAEGKSVPVEIKSFVVWNQFLFLKGKRERSAIHQAERQRAFLSAHAAIIWLPQGRPNLMQSLFGAGTGTVKVVFGGELTLMRAIRSLR